MTTPPVDAERVRALIGRLRLASDSNRATEVGALWNLCDEAAEELEALLPRLEDATRWDTVREHAILALDEDGMVTLVVSLHPEDVPAELGRLLDRGAVTAPVWVDRAIDAARSGPLAPEAR